MLITANILEVIEIWKLLFRVRLVDDFRCCVRTFEESISLIEKKWLSFNLSTRARIIYLRKECAREECNLQSVIVHA